MWRRKNTDPEASNPEVEIEEWKVHALVVNFPRTPQPVSQFIDIHLNFICRVKVGEPLILRKS